MQTYYDDFSKNFRTIFVAFYKVYPSYSGVSEVSGNFFKYWPTRKKFFYFPYNLLNKNNFFLLKMLSFFLKILFLLKIFLLIKFNELRKSKKNLIIIEGASWIFFSYIFFILCKLFLNNIRIIYHSHNIEYEVRSHKKNFFITFITKNLEKKIFQNTISTVVSDIDQKKIYNYYNVKPYVLLNGINEKIIIKKKVQKNFQIIFPGNVEYYFNYISINNLINIIIPKLCKRFPKIKFIITGSNKNYLNIQKKNISFSGFLNKKKYLNILQNSNLLIYPATKAPGTKFKIIESLCHGIIIITTKDGLKGINIIKNSQSVLIYKNYKQLETLVTRCFNNLENIKKNACKHAKLYQKIYSFKNINNQFINNYLLNKL
jgi:hypothetical protein